MDGPELATHIIEWDKFLPRFTQFKAQEPSEPREARIRLTSGGSVAEPNAGWHTWPRG